MKRYRDGILAWLIMTIVPVAILAVFSLFLFVPLFFIGGYGDIEQSSVRKEIFAYVMENKDELVLEVVPGKEIEYAYVGFWDASIEYGYYYSEHQGIPSSPESRYRSGYRFDGYGGDPVDWYYFEPICENWYYYEIHDG